MRREKRNPLTKRETISETNFRLRELAKKSLEFLKMNETKKPVYILKN